MISNEHLLCNLILELLLHPKHLHFATVTCVVAPGMTSVHTSQLASDICQEIHENMVLMVQKDL